MPFHSEISRSPFIIIYFPTKHLRKKHKEGTKIYQTPQRSFDPLIHPRLLRAAEAFGISAQHMSMSPELALGHHQPAVVVGAC
jgi:hypothetical protein